MAKVEAISSKGPDGEEPNVHARAMLYEGQTLRISAYIKRNARHTFFWVPDKFTNLTGFELKGPPSLVVREIWVGVDQILAAPKTIAQLAPKGSMDVNRSVVPYRPIRMEFGR